MRDTKNNSTLVWIGIGCGLLVIVAACVVTGLAGAGVFAFRAAPGGTSTLIPDIDPPPPPPPNGGDRAPRQVMAAVTASIGSVTFPVGTECTFDVTLSPNASGGDWCNAQIRCAGDLLYGGPNAGFFPCQVFDAPRRDVVGQDTQTTVEDSDPAMRLDTRAGVLEVRDDAGGPRGAFSVSARIVYVR